MPNKMEPTPNRHHPSMAERGHSRAKVVTFYKSGDRNFKGVQLPIRKKYNFDTLLSDLDRVSQFPFGVRRIVTPLATHDVTELNDFEDGKMYIMAPTKKKPKPLDLTDIHSKPPWSHVHSLPNSGASSADSEHAQQRRLNGSYGTPRNSETIRTRMVKKVMIMRNGNPRTKHMMLLNRNRIPSFEAFLTDVGETFQMPAQRLYSSDGLKVESLSAIFNGPDNLFVVSAGVEKFRPGSYKENSPFKTSSRQRESPWRKSADDTDQPPQKISKKARGKYRVFVTTSENPAACTDAVVSITVYGDKGKSDDIILGCADGRFEPGNEDEFSVSVGNIGDIYKIRIGHDNSTEFAAWLCEEVRLIDMHAGHEIVFPCGRWMSLHDDDGQTCRELPVILNGNPVLPVINYHVAVVTGNYWNAGTSADVYLTMYGEKGDSGPRLLHKTKKSNKFQKGQTDVFATEAVSLGVLRKIVVRHDTTDPDDCWFLDKVIIKEHKGSPLESVFPCHAWFNGSCDDDSKSGQEIYINNRPTNLEKEMWEQEKWKFQRGNQLMFINKSGSKAVQIKTDGTIEATADPYANQKTAIFEAQKVKGSIYIISSLANPDHCIAFDSNKITAKGKGNEIKLRVQPDRCIVMETTRSPAQVMTFGPTGKPGDVRGSSLGPSRLFYCYVKGIFRDEGIVLFYTSRIQTLTVTPDRACLATGQRSDDAYWRVHKVGDSGSVRMFESLAQPNSFLRIKDGDCDVKGTGNGSCHFKVLRIKDKGYVSLQSALSADVCVGFAKDGTVQPTEYTEEDNVRLYPQVIHFGTKKLAATPTPPILAKPAVYRKKRVMTKQTNSNTKRAAPLPPTRTPTPSPLIGEKSFYDEHKCLEYPPSPTPTPTSAQVEGHFEELEYPYTPIRTPTPTLYPDGDLLNESYADGDWKVLVKTGKVATKSPVVLVVYGDDGVSQPFTLGKGGKELFKAGQEDEFKVNVLNVGDIYKIRIGLDTTSKKASWRLDQVKMKDVITDEQLVFKFKNRWLSAVEDDCDVWRESPAVRPGNKSLQINKYCVQVTTGNEAGSSTDANVYLCLYGEQGDTGGRRLVKSNHQEKFQESQTDIFELEAVSVLTPTKVIVGHDGKGSGAGWFLDEVVIKESTTSKTEYVFPCHRWLDEGQDDKLIERELKLGEVQEIQPYEWQVYVTTGSDNSAGTTAMVTLVVYGDKDMTEVALIPKGENGFQPGTTENFRVYLGDIGQVYKIRIGHDNSATDPSWYLKNVRMLDLNENRELRFEFDRWLSEKHDDLDVWREQPAVIPGKKALPVTRYHIQVYTGSDPNSETHANVYMKLTGKNGDSGKRHLLRSKNNKERTFASGQMDVFEIEAVYLGRLHKVTVGHDGKESGQGWFLEKVVIKESKNAKNEMLFSCKRWLDAGEDDGKIERELVPYKPSAASVKPVTSESASCKTNNITVTWKPPTSGKVTGYYVICDPPDPATSEVTITDARTTKAVFIGLTPGRGYQFDIVAIHGERRSDKVVLKTNAKPNPVTNATLVTTSDTIIVSWSHPDGELTGYKLRLSPSDANKPVLKIQDPSQTRAEFTGLTPDKKYKVDMVTVSGEVQSEKVSLQGTTKLPEVHVLKVPSAETTNVTSDSLTVTWAKPEGDVTGYRLAILPTEGATPEITIDGADNTSAEFTGLSSGQEYTVEVFTVYNDQESEKMTLSARTECQSDQPKNPTATSTETTIEVSWTKPETQVTGYRVMCVPADAEHSEITLEGENTTTAQFEGLTPGRQYGLEIYALSENGESLKTTFTQKTKPNPVADLAVKSFTTDTINLTWTKPDGDLTAYRIDYQPITVNKESSPANHKEGSTNEVNEPTDEINAEIKSILIEDADTTIADVTGLTPGQTYCFNVFTLSSDEESEKVDINQTTMPGTVVDCQMETTPDITSLTWSPPEGHVTGYRVTCTPFSDDFGGLDTSSGYMKFLDRSCQEIVIEGLDFGKEYQVDVCAVSGEVQGECVVLKTTISAEKPLPVLEPQTTATVDSVTVKWTPPDCTYTGFRIVCSQTKTSDLQKSADDSEDDPSNKTLMKADSNDHNLPLEGSKQTRAKITTDKDKNSEEKAPSANEKENSATDLSPSTEGDRLIVQEMTTEAGATEVEFTGLDPMTEYVFDIYTVCNDIESDAVKIEQKTKQAKLPSQGEWKLWISTAEDSKLSDTPGVHIVVYGDQGKTDPIILSQNENNYFQPGNTDEFHINVDQIGEIYKVRIGLDEKSEWSGWHLMQVKMIDDHTEEKLVFDFDRWMSRHEDDFDVVRELPAVREDKETLPVHAYNVCVSTGDRWAAYTDAKMWIVLHGERGDSGKRVLYHSLDHAETFMKGQMDEFIVEAVSLGDVTMVEIGHDGVGYGAGVFINSVIVRESETADNEYIFACNKWLDDHMEDRQTERKLQLLGIRPLASDEKERTESESNSTNWKAVVWTSDCENAATTANAYLTVFGETGRSQRHILQGQTFDDDSQREFEIDIGDIGEITKIRLEHDNSGESPSWHVKQVQLTDPGNQELIFRVNAWLSSDQGECPSTMREIAALRAGVDPLPAVGYIVQVHIKDDEDSASTDPCLYIAINGETGEMAKRELIRTGEPVSEDSKVKVDTFRFDAISVGTIRQITLNVNSNEKQDTWFVEKVTVQEGEYSTTRAVFPCKMWFGNAIIGEDGNTVLQTDLTEQGEETVAKESDPENDGESTSTGNWTIWITPGKENGMGTVADLSVQVYGDKGRSEVIPLRSREDENKNEGKSDDENSATIDEDVVENLKFPPGIVKEFDIEVGEIGPIYKIRLSLDSNDKNENPGIFLDKVKMKDKDTNQEFHFFIGSWLGQADDTNVSYIEQNSTEEQNQQDEKLESDEATKNEKADGGFYLELSAVRPDISPLEVFQYELSVITGDKDASALSDDVIYATVYGERGDTGHRLLRRSNNQDMFDQGQVDVFIIEAVDILRPRSITIGHNSQGFGAGWYLDTVKLKKSPEATTQYVFPCNRWMDTGVDDRQLERNLPLLGEVDCSPPVTSDSKGHWKVRVKTSEGESEGTSTANAFLVVYGENGKSSRHSVDISREEFEIFLDDIGRISKIRLEHDNMGDTPAWHVESVTMVDVDSAEELDFKIDRLLSRDQNDGQICCEVPAVRDGQDSLSVHNYQVKVHTGDKVSASTEGAIHVTLHGTLGDSGQRLLGTSNNAQKFAKGQIDTFTVRAVDLGKIYSISVHNASNEPAQAWYLDKITVKTSSTADSEFVFPSEKWIGAADLESKELKTAQNDVILLLKEKWKCVIHTSDLPDCGTDANVSLVAYGNSGRSKVMTLTNGQEGNFQPGKVSTFELEPGLYIGEIYKIRLELVGGKDASWHLKRVDLQDHFSAECLRFEYNGWLSSSQDREMGDCVAEIPALRPDKDPLPVVSYHLQIFTGDVENPGTDSEISLCVFGETGDTGRRLLNRPRGGEKAFEKPQQIDIFDFKAVSVGTITKVQIHKSTGPPWYLDKLILKEGEFAASETEFVYNGWLGETKQTDQPVDIELTPSDVKPSNTVAALPDDHQPPQSKGSWKVYLTTGAEQTAGVEATLAIVIYGSIDISKQLSLTPENQPAILQPGKTQEFQVNVGEVGQIYKVRILHEGPKEQPAWFLEKFKMKDEDTKAEFSYEVSTWFSWQQEDYDHIVEIPAIWPEIPALQVVKYDIQVLTADEDNAGTQSNVYINLQGEHGDTGRRVLARQPGDDAMFSRGQTDWFSIDAVCLGRIEKCIVGHDGTQQELDWLLDKVIVRESGENTADINFPCNKWLGVGEGNSSEVKLEAVHNSDTSPEDDEEIENQEDKIKD